MSFETISVIGLGYIGLPTAAIFASRRKRVIGVDVNERVVETLNKGESHIVEPELHALVEAAVTEGYLRATTVSEAADAFLIAVPTPFKKDNSAIPEPNLSYVQAAAKLIAPVLKKGDLVILESTVSVGTTEQLTEWLAQSRPDLSFPHVVSGDADVNVAHCPERVLPGHIVRELEENDRVIGGISSTCSERAVELYSCFVKGECVVTNARTAEMAKLAENSCRDVQVAFANELSVICDKLNIDVWELISIANRHPRINILQPGPGVGGHCIAVDPWFIVSKSPSNSQLIKTARNVNDGKKIWVLDKVKLAIADYLHANPSKLIFDITVGCFGLAFKPDIDDLRESPSMWITRELAKTFDGTVVAVDPNISELEGEDFSLVSYNDAIDSVDIAVLLVDHKEFKNGRTPVTTHIVDTKGLWK